MRGSRFFVLHSSRESKKAPAAARAFFYPSVLSGRPRILLGLLLKLLLAVRRAEVVLLSSILCLKLRILFIDLHSTNRIFCHVSSLPYEFSVLIHSYPLRSNFGSGNSCKSKVALAARLASVFLHFLCGLCGYFFRLAHRIFPIVVRSVKTTAITGRNACLYVFA